MDIERMDKRELYKRPVRRRVPKHKVYCILMHGGYVYFPIAAAKAPYIIDGTRPESYLAGMPNFFGGNKDVGKDGRVEDDCTALAREIEEESQGNIQVEIPEAALEEIFRSDEGNGDTYRFYLVKMENCRVRDFRLKGALVFPLRTYEEDLENAPEDVRRKQQCRYEDSHLVGMEEGHFRAFVEGLSRVRGIEEEEERKAQTARLLIEQDITWNATVTSVNNWYGSHTAMAFLAI